MKTSDTQCGTIWVLKEEHGRASIIIVTDWTDNAYLHMTAGGGLFPTHTENLADRLVGYKRVDSLEDILKSAFEERPTPDFGMNPCSEVFLNGKAPF